MLPPEVDSPELDDSERDLLLALHEAFVATGDASWEVDDVG